MRSRRWHGSVSMAGTFMHEERWASGGANGLGGLRPWEVLHSSAGTHGGGQHGHHRFGDRNGLARPSDHWLHRQWLADAGPQEAPMSSDSHGHVLPEVEPDDNDYTAIHQLIVATVVFVIASMIGVNWWLDMELERVANSSPIEVAED